MEGFVQILELVMAVWSNPPFFVFSVPTPYTESVEIIEPFVSSDTVFVLVGLVRQVQVLE